MSPRWSQPDRSLFSEEENQESIHIEGSAPEGAIISNQAPKGEISTTMVIKWSDAIKESIVKLDGPLCDILYKEYHESIVPWSGTDPDSKLNCLNCSKEENDWIHSEGTHIGAAYRNRT